MTSGTRLRERATAVLIRDGNVVLVRAPTLAGYLSFLAHAPVDGPSLYFHQRQGYAKGITSDRAGERA